MEQDSAYLSPKFVDELERNAATAHGKYFCPIRPEPANGIIFDNNTSLLMFLPLLRMF
jgi:hypothetical protein